MKVFLSYGHDSNTPLIEAIRNYLLYDENGNPRHEVWIDISKIKAGSDWRREITDGIINSDVVLAGLSKHSTRNPGVCRDEISISIGIKGGNIKTILLEPSEEVAVPAMISHIQWLDMSDWKDHIDEGFNSPYFQEKFKQILSMIEAPESQQFHGEIRTLSECMMPISSFARIRSLIENEMYGREWLYTKIEEWDKEPKQKIFWIVAGPGFGKSTFAANLSQRYNARIPAVQFVEWDKRDHTDPCCILRNLSFQLAVRFSEYRAYILQLPQVRNKRLFTMSESEIFELLFCESAWMKIDGQEENVWILIDGLDEANDNGQNRIVQTIARHIDKTPHWLRFILTSREDSKVMSPLSSFHPQIFDMEEYVKQQNNDDMRLYICSKLDFLHPSEEQINALLLKSQGVFLYLSLCIDEILNRKYSLDNLEEIPNGLYGYYYDFFLRQYGSDIEKYNRDIAPIFGLIITSPFEMDIPLFRFILDIPKNKFYESIRAVEHVCRVVREKNVNGSITEKIVFFHNSVQNWLTDYRSAGIFFVEKANNTDMLKNGYLKWLVTDDRDVALSNIDEEYHFYGLSQIIESKDAILDQAGIDQLNAILCSMGHDHGGNPALGTFTEMQTHNRKVMLDYCKMLLDTDNEESFRLLLNRFFECIKNNFIQIGLIDEKTKMVRYDNLDFTKEMVSFFRIYDAILCTGSVGYLCRELFADKYVVSRKTYEIIENMLNLLAYYNHRIMDVFFDYPEDSSELNDMADFTERELHKCLNSIRQNRRKKWSLYDGIKKLFR